MATLNLTEINSQDSQLLGRANHSSRPHIAHASAQAHIRPIRPIGPRIAFQPYQQSRLLSIQNPLNERTSLTWDPLDREQHRVLGNGGTISHTWDAAGRETLIENRDKNGVGQFIATNTYSAVNNRLTVVELDGTLCTFGYDANSQITSEARSGAYAYNRSYIWDNLGNRLQQYDSGVLTQNTFNKANELLVSTPAIGFPTTTSYDPAGNTIGIYAGGALSTQTWSAENRLLSYADSTGNSDQFLYSDDGLKKERANASGSTLLTYDEAALLLETNTSLSLEARYTNFPETWGGLASQSRSGVSSFYGYDSQMSARILVSSSGVITDSYSYKAFGEPLQSGSGAVNPYRFCALVLYYLELADLINAWNRWPQPSTSRFRSTDPIGFDGGSWNLYTYADNNPAMHFDPSGKQTSRLPCPDPDLASYLNKYLTGKCASYLKKMYGDCVPPNGQALVDMLHIIDAPSNVPAFCKGVGPRGVQTICNGAAVSGPSCSQEPSSGNQPGTGPCKPVICMDNGYFVCDIVGKQDRLKNQAAILIHELTHVCQFKKGWKRKPGMPYHNIWEDCACQTLKQCDLDFFNQWSFGTLNGSAQCDQATYQKVDCSKIPAV